MGASKCDPSQSLEGSRVITILGTNDIHGGVEPAAKEDENENDDIPGKQKGGMAIFGGIVNAIKQGLKNKYGDQAGVLLVDAGDQFQGTLISNINEGQLVFQAMNEIGYDAVVTGNHDFDFGPLGWLEDQVTPDSKDKNPRGALERVAAQASFPLLSGNTFLKNSIRDLKGNSVEVAGFGCKPLDDHAVIDWSKARRPDILHAYKIKTVSDLRVAMIGLDNMSTPSTTTAANVSDLCFRDEVESYLQIRDELEGKADLFVLVIHNGNTNKTFEISNIVRKIVKSGKNRVLDAVVSGHTHFVRNDVVEGIPVIQSGSGGTKFGRIDLVVDVKAQKITDSHAWAGVVMHFDDCVESAKDICKVQGGHGEPKKVFYEDVEVAPLESIAKLIESERKNIASIAERKLGIAVGDIKGNRVDESALGDSLSDLFRELSSADIAFLNTGGLRAPIKKGDVLYEDLFKVLPFANQGVILSPMTTKSLLAILKRSIQSCGDYGSLMQSGLRVTFTRDCVSNAGVDHKAKLVKVTTLSGEVIFDAESGAQSQRTFNVATLDFLAAGGSGYTGFAGTPITKTLGILREIMVAQLLSQPKTFSDQIDDRLKNLGPK